MRSDALLDSAVFQLTPTRTRCDLVIIANGKTEKIASGLLNPFVSDLKTAQDQIVKGGYSIKLEPDPASEAAWFTKGTVERFVRFVSTPEILERVNTIESEILQIEEAMSSQGNGNICLSSVGEQLKSFGSSEGNIKMHVADEKALVLYKTESHPNPPVSNESKVHEENSKVQLVRVLESRQKILQKEQAMAFARTTAAGFEMENMAHLMLFAESFGASRLREACSRFMQLWEEKHESGQWIDVEATQAFSYRPEFTPLNSSGIIFSEDAVKQKEFIEAWPASGTDLGIETSGNATSLDNDRDRRLFSEPQVPHGQPVYRGQFQHPPFPQWPMMHSQPSPYFLQPYPMQAMPYYQNYPVDGQFLHPPYPPMKDPKLSTHQSKANKQHPKHNKDGSSHSDDGAGQNTSESEGEPVRVRRSHQKASRSGKKKGVVVIRNLNYIASKRHETAGNKSESSSDTEIEENKDMFFDHGGREHKLSGSLKREYNHEETTEFSNVHGKDEELYTQEADAGNWQAFQNFLLEAEEKMNSVVDGNKFTGEKEHPVKKALNKDGLDPTLFSTRDSGSYREESIMEYDAFSGNGSLTKELFSTDELLVSNERRVHSNCQGYDQFKEIDVGVGGYRKVISDDFIMYGLEKQTPNKVSSDPLVDLEYENGNKSEKGSYQNVADESFVVRFRSGIQDQLGIDTRLAIDMASELLLASQKEEDFPSKATTRVIYEPDDLTLILEHTRENESVGYNQTIDSDIQVPLIVKQDDKDEGEVLVSTKEGFINADKIKMKSLQIELEKKRKDTRMKKTTLMRPTHLSEAQKRADKLRNYKSDLQKLKKEHEEQEIKRLEALKKERQKRISSRNGSKVRSPLNLEQSNFDKNSKFEGSEIGLNVFLQRLPRSGSAESNVSNKDIKTATSNKLSQVALSLSELKVSEKQERNSVSARIRRLSEPKGSRVHSFPANSAINNHVIKMALAEELRSKRIPAMVQLDKTNLENLPELKITGDRTSSEVLQNKPSTKQQTVAGGRIPMVSESHCTEMNPEKNPKFSHIDEYPLIEKTVAIFENQVVPVHLAQTSEGWIDAVVKSSQDAKRESSIIDTGCAATYASPSPIDRVEREFKTEDSQNDPINSLEKLVDPAVGDKPYQAPFARSSSLKDAATDNLKYAERSLVPYSEMTMASTETLKAPACKASELRFVHQMYETQEKPQNQKGFRKLWKIGKKGHNSHLGDDNLHSYESLVDDDVVVTPNDFSRPFSILSPFSSRSNEKKALAPA